LFNNTIEESCDAGSIPIQEVYYIEVVIDGVFNEDMCSPSERDIEKALEYGILCV
jgi:hypothetical protein